MINFKDILLNFKEIRIQKKAIENFCIKDEYPNRLPQSKFSKETNSYYSSLYYYDLDSLFDDEKILIIREDGLFVDIDEQLKRKLSRYNIELNYNTMQKDLDKNIETLSKIQEKQELKEKYIELYNDFIQYYNERKPYLLKIDYLFKKDNNHQNESQIENDLIKIYLDKEKKFLEKIKHMSQDNFKEYTRVSNYLKIIDMNKLKLFIAYVMLKKAKSKKNPARELTYLKEYLIRNANLIDKDYKITNRNISIKTIYTETIKLVENKEKKNKENTISPKEELEKYNYTFLELDPKEFGDFRGYIPRTGPSDTEEEAKKELLKRKTDYYKTLKIKKIKIGINSFEGYIGICLEDGTVILDKFFENIRTGKIADDEAVYITTEEEFEKVTKLSKTECINQIKQGKIKAKHKYHRGNWEDNLLK